MHAEPKYPAKDVNESFTCFRHAALPISSVLTSNFSRQLALLIKRRLGPMTKDQPFILAAGQGTAASHSIADAIQSTGINTIHFRECQPACKTTVREICEVTDKLELFARQMKHPFRNVSLLEIVSGVLSAFDVALQARMAVATALVVPAIRDSFPFSQSASLAFKRFWHRIAPYVIVMTLNVYVSRRMLSITCCDRLPLNLPLARPKELETYLRKHHLAACVFTFHLPFF
eukprot:6204350-Pleurochrysis_carterae.AAC.3